MHDHLPAESWYYCLSTVIVVPSLRMFALTVGIPEGWELQFSKNPIFGPNFFTASWDPKNTKKGTNFFFFAQQNFERVRPQIS
jgi:hypothetical protein